MTEIVHAVPPTGSGLTPCCGRTPIELPLTDRITSEETVTCPGPLLMPGEWHDAPTADAERYKADYLRACETVAQMHAAATGRPGEGPTRGVVEDVEDVRRRAERAEAALDQVHHLATRLEEFAENALRDDDRKLYTAIANDIRTRTDHSQAGQQPAPAGHRYLSTGCLHGDHTLPDGRTGHQYCQSATGKAGNKAPAQCKFCGAPCVCGCHGQAAPAPSAPPEHVDWRRILDGFDSLLQAFPADLDPDGPAVRPRPLPAASIARWRDTVHTARKQYANQTTEK